MKDLKVQHTFSQLERALRRLQEALAETTDNSLVIDGTIQRFKFVMDLYWKLLKHI
jgi:hypothetical protein